MDLDRRTPRAQRRLLAVVPGAAVLPLLAFALALLPAAAVAFQQPLWSRVDEAQHFDFIVQLANGTYPVSDRTTLRPETVRIMDRTGIYRWFQPKGDAQPSETDPRTFRMPPTAMPAQARSQWMWRHIWTFSYEAFQPPLYYLLMVPVYAAGHALGGPVTAVYLLRLVNALLVAGLAPLAWLLAREVLPGRPWFAVAAAVAAVAVPGLLVNLTQVTNDALAAVLGALVVVLAVRWMRTGFDLRKAAVLGALLGAAALTKLTVLGLVPAVALAVLVRSDSPGDFGRRLGLGAVSAAVAGLVLAPWVFVNERLYGHALPPHDFMSAVFVAPRLTLRLIRADVGHAILTYWTGEPVGIVPLTDPVLQYALYWTLAACAGLAILGLARRPFVPGTLLVLAAAVAGEAVLAGVMPVFSQVGGLTPGRYIYPAAPAVATLLVAGAWALLPIGPARASVVLCMVGVAGASVSAFLHGYTGDRAVLEKHYVPPPSQGVPISASAAVAGVTVTADRFVDASGQGDVWVHVVVDNPTSKSIEWWPRPDVVVDGAPYTRTDYGRSQVLPETIEPGQHDDVWLVAPAATPGPYHHLALVFEAIASDDYRQYGNLRMEAELPPPA